MPTWIIDLVRNLFFAIDSVVYYFFSVLYELLMYLANVNIFGTNSDVISEFLRRVYAILGIFMLFKVSFSVLQYIVDPNSFSDQSKGMGKLVRNVLLVLVLLALTPALFDIAFDIQGTILKSNVIGKLILGNSTGDKVDAEQVNNTNVILANDMRFLVFGSFFTVNDKLIPECAASPVLGTKAMAGNEATNSEGKTCLQQVSDLITDETYAQVHDFFRINNNDERKFESFGALTALSKDNEHYFNYQFGISTIAGIFVVVMLLKYCIDVAVRVIKLFFLELIAPIPIVSFVDPKQGKDGILATWAKECGKTYISLFLRLAIIFLAFYLIDMVSSMNLLSPDNYYNGDEPSGIMGVLVSVMIILGILIFAGQVPKLIEEIFGFKSSGDLGINPLKAITSSPLASAAVGGVVGGAVGLAANTGNLALNFARNVKKDGLGKTAVGFNKDDWAKTKGNGMQRAGLIGRGALNFVRGGFAGTRSVVGGTAAGAVRSGYASKDGKLKEGIKSGHDQVIMHREARDAKQKQSIGTRTMNAATKFTGTKNEFGERGTADAALKRLDERRQQNAQIQNHLRELQAEISAGRNLNFNELLKAKEGVYDYEKYKEEANMPNLTEEEYNNLSYADRYEKLSGELSSDKDVFNEAAKIQEQINQTTTLEAEFKKEISDMKKAAGIEDDKK